jgi:hypothetical protein
LEQGYPHKPILFELNDTEAHADRLLMKSDVCNALFC